MSYGLLVGGVAFIFFPSLGVLSSLLNEIKCVPVEALTEFLGTSSEHVNWT